MCHIRLNSKKTCYGRNTIHWSLEKQRLSSLPARMYMPLKPASMLINVPEYGERYFEKFE